MTPYFSDAWLDIYQGDVRDVLPSLPADSVDCIVTSPPYWGLRDYGGDGQLGLERTPEEYVANMVGVFRELRRVLKPSGTCWLNLGDSYSGYHGNGKVPDAMAPSNKPGYVENMRESTVGIGGLKPKDLVGIPWRVAFALQADGWYLRSDIIWAKPNPMPESVTDRPTKSHEYLFLLTKSARYFFDADAVREAALQPYGEARLTGQHKADAGGFTTNGHGPSTLGTNQGAVGRNLRSVWTIATKPYPGAHFAVFPPELPERCIKAGSSERGVCPETGEPWERVVERRPMTARTTGDAWQEGRSEQIATGRRGRSRPGSFTPAPYVAPSDLDRYGTGEAGVHRKVGGQYQKWLDANPPQTTGWRPTCGAPWERVVERGTREQSANGTTERDEYIGVKGGVGATSVLRDGKIASRIETGWRPTCDHDAEPVPAVVLDPFAGSGTTGVVANRLSRRAILVDLNGDYLKQQLKRNAQTPLGLGA